MVSQGHCKYQIWSSQFQSFVTYHALDIQTNTDYTIALLRSVYVKQSATGIAGCVTVIFLYKCNNQII